MARITLGITGASGGLYARRLLQALVEAPGIAAIDLVVSRHGRAALREELGIPSEGALDLEELAQVKPTGVVLHSNDDVAASIASGSFPSLGMIVAPCSMASVARVAQGISDSLLSRAADVCLKERRRLVLLVREAPFSIVHLRNMLAAAEAGAIIFPAAPPLYTEPRSIQDLIDAVVARVLDHFAIAHGLGKRWKA